ncbi:hypothetical protein OGAPHI_003508 [Ogataea philodendri]|uniref:Uncharacterized protein n=1 Tax=Ogataea philodendri TaxID=1378263 RepID=A0A9P8P716_9ASCO|nr:uncharacterized protein OGAPHI_003508 [Ogataea philodendri]KAH3666512.1 hypothetical protein OGAPHI_003508 [Ogataea philodendri]
MQDIWHQFLESGILDTSNAFGSVEVSISSISCSLSCVVNKILCHFSKRSAFFTEVCNHSISTLLGFLGGLSKAKDQITSARADIGEENIRTRTFVVNSKCQTLFRIWNIFWVSENVNGCSSDWWEERFNIRTSDQFWVHSVSVFK